jgi:TPR repeat protein
VYVRNTGDTDLHVARVFMPTGISWYSDGWFTIAPGKSRRVDDEGGNRPMYLGFAVVNDRGQLGAVRYRFDKGTSVMVPTRKEFPVRPEAWGHAVIGDHIDRPREGFTMVPFSLYLNFVGGRDHDLTIRIDARSNVEVIPFGPQVAAAPAPAPGQEQIAAPSPPAKPQRPPPTLKDQGVLSAHLIDGAQILSWGGGSREWYLADGSPLIDALNPTVSGVGVLRPERGRPISDPQVAKHHARINQILGAEPNGRFTLLGYENKLTGRRFFLDDCGVVTFEDTQTNGGKSYVTVYRAAVDTLDLSKAEVEPFGETLTKDSVGVTVTIPPKGEGKIIETAQGLPSKHGSLEIHVNSEEDARAILKELEALAGLYEQSYRIGPLVAAAEAPKATEPAPRAPAGPHPDQVKADAGDPEAMHQLGEDYAKGLFVDKSREKSVHWYRKAAEKGHAPSMVRLADAYLDGKGVERDYDQAALWARRAADKDHDEGLATLGIMHAAGLGVPQDHDRAEALAKKSLSVANRPAGAFVALCYWEGAEEKDFKITRDQPRARRILEFGAARGNEAAKAMLETLNGKDVRPDQPATQPASRPSAEAIDAPGAKGPDPEALEKAAAGGDVDAMLRLGSMYEHGSRVEKDAARARACYTKAAEAGKRYRFAHSKSIQPSVAKTLMRPVQSR